MILENRKSNLRKQIQLRESALGKRRKGDRLLTVDVTISLDFTPKHSCIFYPQLSGSRSLPIATASSVSVGGLVGRISGVGLSAKEQGLAKRHIAATTKQPCFR